jgi:pimeloyl-ACP methyl ester carboxylesterase
VRIFYERTGEAGADRALLLIPPLGLDGRLWSVAGEVATEHGYAVLALDNRGCGRSDAPWRPWTTSSMAADGIAVLDHAGVERAHVCGPSLGGLVAQELAIGYPERVGALVLASTTAGLPRIDLLPFRSILAALTAPARRLLPRGSTSQEQRIHGLLSALVSAEAAQEATPGGPLWTLAEQLLHEPPSSRARLWQLFAAAPHAAWHRLARINAPTQIQHGTADRVIPVRAAHELAKGIPTAELRLHEGAGHALILERTGEVARTTMTFLTAHDGSLTG